MLKSRLKEGLRVRKALEDHCVSAFDVDEDLPFLCSRDDRHTLAGRGKLENGQDLVVNQDLARDSDGHRLWLANLYHKKRVCFVSGLCVGLEGERKRGRTMNS